MFIIFAYCNSSYTKSIPNRGSLENRSWLFIICPSIRLCEEQWSQAMIRRVVDSCRDDRSVIDKHFQHTGVKVGVYSKCLLSLFTMLIQESK